MFASGITSFRSPIRRSSLPSEPNKILKPSSLIGSTYLCFTPFASIQNVPSNTMSFSDINSSFC